MTQSFAKELKAKDLKTLDGQVYKFRTYDDDKA